MDYTKGPVLKTLAGCRQRIATMSLGERWALCFTLKVNDEKQLARRLWTGRRHRTQSREGDLYHGKDSQSHQ